MHCVLPGVNVAERSWAYLPYLTMMEERILNLFVKILNHFNYVINFIFINTFLSIYSYILKSLYIILNKHKIIYLDISNINKLKSSDEFFPDT